MVVLVLYTSLEMNEPLPATVYNSWLGTLPDFMKNEINLLRRWQDRQAGLIGKVLLQKALAHFNMNISLTEVLYTTYKKPYLMSGLNFNISHSGGLVVCAASTSCNVGIDVEHMQSILLEEFREQITDHEWNTIINHDNSQQAFYKYWTEKESVIKANGKGLSIPLKNFEVVSGNTVIENRRWHVKEIALQEGYYCTLATDEVIVDLDLVCCNSLFEQ